MTTTVPEKAHAALGASAAHRWVPCPGSINRIRNSKTVKSSDTVYSREGTVAHHVAEQCLRHGKQPRDYRNIIIDGITVDDEMILAVDVFVQYCRELMDTSTSSWIEQEFSLDYLNPPEPMHGTADFVAYNERTRILRVNDYKHGAGVVVYVEDNLQLKYYALGVLAWLRKHHSATPEKVIVTIVQPRARLSDDDTGIHSVTYSLTDMIDFEEEILSAAWRTQEPNAPLHAGEHCRFCPARSTCPEQRRIAEETAQIDFAIVATPIRPTPPAEMTPEQLGDILHKLEIIQGWANAVRGHVQGLLEMGHHVPGWKLVEKRAQRKWARDDREIIRWLGPKYMSSAYMETSLKSPAQLESSIGKKAFRTLPPEFFHKISSGVTLAPDVDGRPAVLTDAQSTFEPIPSLDDIL